MNHQLDLFSSSTSELPTEIEQSFDIEGLSLINNYISLEEEQALLAQIDAQPWLLDLKRRVQHYGYKYDYRARRIDVSMKIGALPDWANGLAERLQQEGYFKSIPDQVIVNEYEVGQGIAPHIDCEPCFEDTIASLSLNSTATMNFTHTVTNEKVPVFLSQRSLVIMKGESRYDWKHSIPARKKDKTKENTYPRTRRVSLTFRSVIV
ncbi:MAG: alpha-ketoglutarate-dependent dioxygenase AlkB [Bacteroidota bacterium]